MIVYKVKDNNVKEVECEEMKYPLPDSDGDTIYTNTHFTTKKEAYENAIKDCEAGISIITREISSLRDKVRDNERILADECIELLRLKKEFSSL